ncbi:uncharacterized protein LOC128924115 [Zeugodacus cucurbitae]|uniref:uncharacterized protein LOC128924115 n=1 Tax=Zeugodacus cucurbitae TaxID=28588 RepID=UPI0023D93829|nr:uncharacterized protein LOC128924115 [Zeugodacus cucurbitae]
MQVIHFAFVLCCLCVHRSFGAPRLRQPAKWQPIAATTVAPAPKSFASPVKRSPQLNSQFNETHIALPLLPNNTEAVHELKSEHAGKVYDHKHRMLLAVQSDVKVRDGGVKQPERSKTSAARNNDPEARKRLKEGLKDLLSKLHPLSDSANESDSESELGHTNGNTNGALKSDQSFGNMPKNRQRSSALAKALDCEDIPFNEALLHSALLDEGSDAKSSVNGLTKPEVMPAVSIEDLTELRRKLLKSRRNRMKMLPPFRRYPHYAWPPHSAGFNSFNMQHPYNCDCNYFLNPVNEMGVPTIEYIWEDYDEVGDNVGDNVKTDKKVVK